jgi:hypothetical protein
MKKITLLLCMIFLVPSVLQALDAQTERDAVAKSMGRVERLIHHYERAFTVLAYKLHDYMPIVELAQKHPDGVFVIIDDRPSEDVLKKCRDYILQNIIILRYNLSLAELVRLSECEHFDIVFTANHVTSSDQRWREHFNAGSDLGEYTFIVTKNPDEPYEQYCKQQGGVLLKEMENAALFLLHKEKHCLMRRRWNYFKANSPQEYTIQSSFKDKLLIKNKRGRKQEISSWNPGINLVTFQILNGIYPAKKSIRRLLEQLKYVEHNDMKIFNLILGHGITPIDCAEAGRNWDKDRELQHIMNIFRGVGLLERFSIADLIESD